MKLSKNFTLEEFTFSQTALSIGVDNTPNDEQIKNLRYLCQEILQPLRFMVGRPLTITSGFRCRTLNSFIGGVENSHHLCLDNFAAADFVPNGESIDYVFELIKDSELPFTKLIHERVGENEWLHISARRPDREILVAKEDKNGKVIYELLKK